MLQGTIDMSRFQYAVIELDGEEGKYACVAPTNWLSEAMIHDDDGVSTKQAKCWWPVHEKRLSDYVERRKKPDLSNKWRTIFRVPILKLCSKCH